MTAGIQIYNNNNILQITEEYRNFQFINKVTVTLTDLITSYQPSGQSVFLGSNLWGTGTPLYSERVVLTPEQGKMIYAYRCNNGKFVQCMLLLGRYAPDIGNPILTISGEQGAEVTIYFFDYNNIPPGQHFEVRDSNSNVVFSDQGKFMKVISSVQGVRTRPTTIGTVLGTVSHDSNITSAISAGCLTWEVNIPDVGFPPNAGYTGVRLQAFNFQSNQIISTYQVLMDDSVWVSQVPSSYYWTNYAVNYQYLVLDVTGL
jgi:hypothetical protein